MTARRVSILNAEAGTVFPGRPRTLSASRVLAFSGGPLDQPSWPARNIHTDAAKARDAGLERIIASGTQSEGILIGHLINLCGMDWYRNGRIEVRFVKSVFVGETVAPFVRLVGHKPSESVRDLTFDVWCDKADDVAVVVGTASCSIPIT